MKLRSIYLALWLMLSLVSAGATWAQETPVVRAVLFFSPTCPHCHYVMEEVLPPLQQVYGNQLQILAINVNQSGGAQLYRSAIVAFAIPDDRLGVPTLIIGDTALVGSLEIPEQLPGLIEKHLTTGGVNWPAIPGLEAALPQPTLESALAIKPVEAVVHGMLFYSSDCPACRKVVSETLPPLREEYGGQLDIQLIDIVTAEDVDWLYRVGAGFGIPKDNVDLPLLIIGDDVLIGSGQIPAELPGLVERYLATGGVAPPMLPDPADAPPPDAIPAAKPMVAQPPSNGFALAFVVMIGMVGALIYGGGVLVRGIQKGDVQPVPAWLELATPLLALIGLGVAVYLAYVETQAVPAVCGPVGDCNAVQSSPYARLFGVLPIGVLGVMGYAAILAAWLWGRYRSGRLADVAPLTLFGMTVFGVLFSLYLTYLEPFVIRAVCLWCLASAVIMTLLLLISLRPTLRALKAIRSFR